MATKFEVADIQAALAMLDVSNDEHWVDGKPNLLLLQEALGSELTVEEVNSITGGADRIAIARGRGIIMSVPESEPVNVAEIARKETQTAQQKLASLEAQLGANATKREALNREQDALNKERDRLVRVVTSGEQVSSADAVKAIQAQSVQARIDQKAAVTLASAAMRAAGIGPTYPSVLDQQLASRKRGPEHVKAMAAFVHQSATERNAARG